VPFVWNRFLWTWLKIKCLHTHYTFFFYQSEVGLVSNKLFTINSFSIFLYHLPYSWAPCGSDSCIIWLIYLVLGLPIDLNPSIIPSINKLCNSSPLYINKCRNYGFYHVVHIDTIYNFQKLYEIKTQIIIIIILISAAQWHICKVVLYMFNFIILSYTHIIGISIA